MSKNGLCALYADPGRAGELGRRSGKARRYVIAPVEPARISPPQNAREVKEVLGQVMSDLLARKLDPRVANTTAYIGGVLLRAIEIADLEERIAKLEGKSSESKREG